MPERLIVLLETMASVSTKRSLGVFTYFTQHPEIDPDMLWNLQFDGWVKSYPGRFRNRDYEDKVRLLTGYYAEVWGENEVDVRIEPEKNARFSEKNINHFQEYLSSCGGRGALETKYQIWKRGEGRDNDFFIQGLRSK